MGNLSKQNRNPKSKDKGWKFQDDYTGFMEYSHNAEMDEDGYITKKGNADLPDPTRKGINPRPEQIPPWTRPQTGPVDADLSQGE